MWTAIYTHSKYEHRVDAELDRIGVEHYLPTFSIERKYFCRNRITIDFPLFPGYVFARLNAQNWDLVLAFSGVCAILHGEVTESEMATVRLMAEAGAQPVDDGMSDLDLSKGVRIRMKRGPLVGVCGKFVKYGDKLHGVLVVTVEMLGRSIATPVDRCDAELSERRRPVVHVLPAAAALVCSPA